MGTRFASLLQAQNFLLSRGLASQEKAWVNALPLSNWLSVSPPRFKGSHRKTRLGSTLWLSPPGLAFLFGELRARIAGQVLGPCFASLHQGQRVSSQKRRFPPQTKAWVHTSPLSTRLTFCPRRVAGSHRTTRIGSTFCLFLQAQRVSLPSRELEPPGQSLGPRFAFLHQVQRFSLENRRLAPRNKAWANALPLSSKLSASPCQDMGLHRRTWPGSTLRLSLSGSACLLSESWD